MGSSADWFLIAVLFLISIDTMAGLIAGITATTSTCDIINPGGCWSRAGFPASPGSYVYGSIGGYGGINLTPVVNVFLWLYGAGLWLGSLFVIYITFPSVFGGVISGLEVILEVMLVRGLLW